MRRKHIYYFPILLFVLIWGGVMGVLYLLPVTPRFGNMLDITTVNSVFILIISITALLWVSRIGKIKIATRQKNGISKKKLDFIIKVSVISSILGLIFVLWDRVFVRGIDYSRGVRAARYQWLELGDAGSIVGKIGNLLVPFCYCALFLSIYHWEILERKKRIIGTLTGIGVQIGFAAINGGRSNILIAFVFILATCLIRQGQGKTFTPPIRMKQLLIVILAYCLVQYCLSILYAFADNNVSYLYQTVYLLGGKLSDTYYKYVSPLRNTIINIILYLFHGNYYTGAVLTYMPESVSMDQNISLRMVWSILDRLGLIDYNMQLPAFDSGGGAFIAVPGILLYDYGFIGFVVLSIIIGILFGITINEISYKKNNMGIINLIVCIIVLMHIILSPVTMALGIGYFTFMIFALFAMEIIAGLLYGFSSWITVIE